MKKIVFILILAIPLLAFVDTRAEEGGMPNKTADVEVTFEGCHCVIVESTKDLSNVVFEIDPCEGGDNEFIKIEDLEGYGGCWCFDYGHIVRVWVKSGNNKSGDGPGYGERFENYNY